MLLHWGFGKGGGEGDEWIAAGEDGEGDGGPPGVANSWRPSE